MPLWAAQAHQLSRTISCLRDNGAPPPSLCVILSSMGRRCVPEEHCLTVAIIHHPPPTSVCIPPGSAASPAAPRHGTVALQPACAHTHACVVIPTGPLAARNLTFLTAACAHAFYKQTHKLSSNKHNYSSAPFQAHHTCWDWDVLSAAEPGWTMAPSASCCGV